MTKYITGSTKTYVHSTGLSCCFRQWKASSHCNTMHGYALEVRVEFEGDLDERNWIVDFGGLKPFKAWLEGMFDHTTLVAIDDPHLVEFEKLDKLGIIDIRLVQNVGCEAFAAEILTYLEEMFRNQDRIKVTKVEVREHQGNSAYVRRAD
jgi:6-pyruvoyltetrahydropterin/6-carboxytetrahydropterin synthase